MQLYFTIWETSAEDTLIMGSFDAVLEVYIVC